MSVAELRADLVILACAVSAGIHGALTPEHFREGVGPGMSFALATLLLAAAAVALTLHPSQGVLLATIALFAGLVVSYVLVVANGLPVVHPEREAVTALALFTKAVELGGLLAAAALLQRPARAFFLHPKGTLT